MKKRLAILLMLGTISLNSVVIPQNVCAENMNSCQEKGFNDNQEVMFDGHLIKFQMDEKDNKIRAKDITAGDKQYAVLDCNTGEISGISQSNILSADMLGESKVTRKGDVTYKKYYFSYRKIKDMTNKGITCASIALSILSLGGVSVIGGAADVIAILSNSSNLISKGSTKHGIWIKIKRVRHYRNRMGRRNCYKITHEFVGAGRY